MSSGGNRCQIPVNNTYLHGGGGVGGVIDKCISTKSIYSILKYNCSLSFGYLKQHYCMGITLLTKEIKPKNIFYRNEIQYRDGVPTKRKVGM